MATGILLHLQMLRLPDIVTHSNSQILDTISRVHIGKRKREVVFTRVHIPNSDVLRIVNLK